MWSTHLSAIFWDGFDAMTAIGVLARSGFATQEICVLGILNGPIPDLEPTLTELGLSESEAAFFKQLFDEGAIVLVVRAQQEVRRKAAARLMEHCGGLLAPKAVLN